MGFLGLAIVLVFALRGLVSAAPISAFLHATALASYMPASWIIFSGRAIGTSKAEIEGQDAQIALPVQTTDPENYGGRTVELGLGVNLAGQDGWLRRHRLAAEYRYRFIATSTVLRWKPTGP